MAGQAFHEAARTCPRGVPEPGSAEIAGLRVPVAVRRRYTGCRRVDIDGVVRWSGAEVAVAAEVGAARQLQELPIAGLVGIVTAGAVLAPDAGIGRVGRAGQGKYVALERGDGAVVATEAKRLEARVRPDAVG